MEKLSEYELSIIKEYIMHDFAKQVSIEKSKDSMPIDKRLAKSRMRVLKNLNMKISQIEIKFLQ